MTARPIFEGQLLNLVALGVLLAGLYLVGGIEGFQDGSFLGVDSRTWTLAAVVVPIVHQAYVWFCWRTQLHGQLLTRLLGSVAFGCYALVFFLLLVGRLALILAVAIANRNSLDVDPILANVLALVLAVPVAYAFYSVHRYFGFRRAAGIDHFDPAYRSLPLVRKGIFRWTPNGMYVFGLLILWIPGLCLRSTAALAVALFSHLYIWVHYYCTEKPDMARIHAAV